jgi:hypothetical protein
MSDLMVDVGVVKERFRRDTSDVETSSTKSTPLFYASSLETFLGSLDGSNVTSRSSTY